MNDIYIKTGVIGWPISHSRSPLIHNYWIKAYGLSGVYEHIAVSPDDAAAFFSTLKTSNFTGANVTIPHKQGIMRHLDEMDEAALSIGAVNTIWRQGDKLIGTNTDWLGFLCNLDSVVKDWDTPLLQGEQTSALVLGAGGASRAILYALLQRNFSKIYLANRTLARAYELQDHFGAKIVPISLSDAKEHVGHVDLIVNTTSLGMEDNPPLDLPLEPSREDCLITDIVYSPLETPLLVAAKKLNRKTVDGLGMLLHQAVPGFEKWFGVKPQVSDDLRMLVLKDMGLVE